MGVKMKALLFAFALIFLVPLASATQLDYYETVIGLDDESSNFTFIFLFKEAPNGALEYPLPFSIKNFETSANFGNYECEARSKDWGSLIICDFSEVKEGGRALNIKFTATKTLKEMEKNIFFNANIKTPQNVGRMLLKVVLEKGYVLIEAPEGSTTLVPYSPSNGIEGSDGRRIFVEWERKNVEKGDGIDVSVAYEKIGPSVSGNQNITFLFIGLLILLIAVLVGTRGRKKESPKLDILKDNEKKVLDIINQRGGLCKQRVIVRETDFSKAKVSRLVKDLEERGLITTEKIGRTKKIYIKQ